MWWPFRKKLEPPAPPTDRRVWNDDWQVGDIAEVVSGNWHETVEPWNRLPLGSRWVVTGFMEGESTANTLEYWLELDGAPLKAYSTRAFRKVRPQAKQKSEIVERILNAPAGKDVVREDV